MIRNILEKFSRGKVLKRHLPPAFGKRPIYVSPDSALSYIRINWIKPRIDLFDAAYKYVSHSDNVWDIGSNVGIFTFAAAHIVGSRGEVISVEADPFLASLLQKTAIHRANSDLNVRIMCIAISDHFGIADFAIAERGRSSNSLADSGPRTHKGGARYIQPVPLYTLDSLLGSFSRPDVIKIDVEGSEINVLKGADRILSEIRPRIYIEVGSVQKDEATSILKSYGYQLFNGDRNDGIELDKCCYNTLAIPKEYSGITKSGK